MGKTLFIKFILEKYGAHILYFHNSALAFAGRGGIVWFSKNNWSRARTILDFLCWSLPRADPPRARKIQALSKEIMRCKGPFSYSLQHLKMNKIKRPLKENLGLLALQISKSYLQRFLTLFCKGYALQYHRRIHTQTHRHTPPPAGATQSQCPTFCNSLSVITNGVLCAPRTTETKKDNSPQPPQLTVGGGVGI